MLIVFKIAFGVATGVIEYHSVGAVEGAGKGNDERLLYGGVHYAIVGEVARSIVDRDVDVAEALIEMDVDRAFIGPSYYGVRGSTKH